MSGYGDYIGGDHRQGVQRQGTAETRDYRQRQGQTEQAVTLYLGASLELSAKLVGSATTYIVCVWGGVSIYFVVEVVEADDTASEAKVDMMAAALRLNMQTLSDFFYICIRIYP